MKVVDVRNLRVLSAVLQRQHGIFQFYDDKVN